MGRDLKSTRTRRRGIKRKISHHRRVLREQTIHAGNLLPGMVLRFVHNERGIYDRRPLILFLYKQDDKIEGVNLNYLHEYKVQELFDRSLQMFEGRINDAFRRENFFNLNEQFVRVGLTNKLAPSDVDAKEFFDRAINPRFLKMASTKNCYRSYKLKNISAMKIINYDIEILKEYKKTGKFNLFGENVKIEEK